MTSETGDPVPALLDRLPFLCLEAELGTGVPQPTTATGAASSSSPLSQIIDRTSVSTLLGDIAETVERGVASLAVQKLQRFDVATQLVDLACAVALVDGRVAAKLVMDVLSVAPSHRTLVHAISLLHRSQSPEVQQLGGYLTSIGDEQVRHMVTQALRQGGGSHARQP
ncbi:hypothetical protein [Streptomyces vastus]|uniref:Uncharacterized protein n=1 Tax=Streptomyces vastus TaxID=285451 RepID=A0ABN3RPM2_9ACTN